MKLVYRNSFLDFSLRVIQFTSYIAHSFKFGIYRRIEISVTKSTVDSSAKQENGDIDIFLDSSLD